MILERVRELSLVRFLFQISIIRGLIDIAITFQQVIMLLTHCGGSKKGPISLERKMLTGKLQRLRQLKRELIMDWVGLGRASQAISSCNRKHR